MRNPYIFHRYELLKKKNNGAFIHGVRPPFFEPFDPLLQSCVVNHRLSTILSSFTVCTVLTHTHVLIHTIYPYLHTYKLASLIHIRYPCSENLPLAQSLKLPPLACIHTLPNFIRPSSPPSNSPQFAPYVHHDISLGSNILGIFIRHSCTHSLIISFTHSLTHSLIQSLTHSWTHSRTRIC